MNRTNLLHDRRQDNLANVHPEVRLELERALRVEEQVARESRKVVAEALVERVVAHGLEPVTDSAEEVVEVALVLLVVEAAARVADRLALVVALGLENEAGLEENLARVRVNLAPPFAELLVILRVVDEVVGGVEHRVHALVVGEALEKCAELAPGGLEGVVLRKESNSGDKNKR